MNHLTENQLNEYLDQVLDPASEKQVKIHLDTCEQCRTELTELEMLFSTFDKLPDIALTRDLTLGVLASLLKPIQMPRLWRQPAFLMQSLLTLILVGVSIPVLQTQLEQIASFESTLIMPIFTFPTWTEIATEIVLLLRWRPEFAFTLPEFALETLTLPLLPVSFEPSIIFTLVTVATILWGVGNFFLLRNKPEVRG